MKYKKVLVIGSGPIVIGQAAEFDYAGVQACRVLKQEGIEIVLLNSNPATIMTDENIADKVYIEPITKESAQKIIEKEKPDGVFATFGGQTSINLLYELVGDKILEKNNVEVLGTSFNSVKLSEDRELFKTEMQKNNIPVLSSVTVSNVSDAKIFIQKTGYPVVLRPAYTLGGEGGAFVKNDDELTCALTKSLKASLISQVLIEKSVEGFKEIEFEIVRDNIGNSVSVCNMENIDSMGIHTGDSMVVAPCQTLSDNLLKILKKISFKIADILDIKGSCNIQYAVNPDDETDFYVIEVNPRVSRSSALASKATGFPIAKIAAKIALGYNLTDFDNNINNLEPKPDYVVVKIPKWSFDKFKNVDRTLTTQMKSTGEVMALGKTFEEAFYKAMFSTENQKKNVDDDVSVCDDLRIYRILQALKNGKSIDEISSITNINKFFINKFNKISEIKSDNLNYFSVKPYCDKENHKQSYFYSSVKENNYELKSDKKKILILGSGPVRIGQGIEFDYCCVHCVNEIKKLGFDAVLINSNPETLSTDYDVSTRLYFEPLTSEFVKSVIEFEKPEGVIIQYGGQTPINIIDALKDENINILGTSYEGLNTTEDRFLFSELLKKLQIPQAKGYGIKTIDEALEVVNNLKYPVIVRPSYTIGGLGVKFVKDEPEFIDVVNDVISKINEHSVLIDEYIDGLECEADVICDGEDILIAGFLEHVEKTGVHSGDSVCIYPAKCVSEKMFEYAQKISKELNFKGLMNIQFIVKDEKVYVLEVNPRASRTVPVLSKLTGLDICKISTDIILGKSLKELGYNSGIYKTPNVFGVKIPVFNFSKLPFADETFSTEMKSTGEVLGIDYTLEGALQKALIMAKIDVNNLKNDEFKNFYNSLNVDFGSYDVDNLKNYLNTF